MTGDQDNVKKFTVSYKKTRYEFVFQDDALSAIYGHGDNRVTLKVKSDRGIEKDRTIESSATMQKSRPSSK
jgi:hypothetical protein